MIDKIIETEDGKVYTVTSLKFERWPPSIDELVEMGLSREQAENMEFEPNGIRMRVTRSKHLETEIEVDDSTKDLIDGIKNKKQQ